MNDDELMQSLGELARERSVDGDLEGDPRWRTLASSELSAAEEEALRREAASSGQAQRALDAFQPLGTGARARIVDRLKTDVLAEPTSELEPVSDPSPEAPVIEHPAGPRPVVGPKPEVPGASPPAVRRASGTWWLMPLAAAAVLCVVLLWPANEPLPVPAYDLLVEGGLKSVRTGEPVATDPVRLRPGRRLVLTLRPKTEVEDPIEVRAFLGRDGVWRPWDVAPQIVPGGVARLEVTAGEGSAGSLPAEVGRWQVALAVGRSGEMPDAAALSAALIAASPETLPWALLRTEIEVEVGPVP